MYRHEKTWCKNNHSNKKNFRQLFSYSDLKEKVMEVLNKTYKKHNADRFKSLGLTEKETDKKYFNATSLLGAKLFGNHFGLFLLNSDPWIEPIIDYETIGSGAPFADLMLQQLNRGLDSKGISFLTAWTCLHSTCLKL